MRFRILTALCPALLLLGFAWTLAGLRAPLPTGDEATSVLMVQSLWHDHDAAFREADLARAAKIWDGGPAGLTLFTNDGGKTLRYGRPLAYPLAALPFYGVLGVRGIALFNMALFLAMAGAGLWLLKEETGLAGLFVAGFFFASAALAYAFRMEPEVFLMACAFFPLLLWQRLRSLPDLPDWRRRHLAGLAAAGALVGAALTSSPLLAVLGVPVLIDLALRRRFRGVLVFLAGLLLAAGALTLLQRVGTQEWTPFGGAQRRTFTDEFPLESPRDLWQGYRGESGEPVDGTAGLKLLPGNLVYLLAGRYTGLLPYFPFALFALALYLLGSKDRSRHLLLAALAVYVLAVLIAHPRGFTGDPGFLGSRYLALAYPAFLFLPGRISARRSLALPYAAAGLWTAAAVAGSLARLAPEAPLQLHAQAPAFQRLPLELTLLAADRLPGYVTQTWGDALWIFPRWSFFAEERHPHGVWARGGTRSEVIVVSPKPLSRLRFLAYSLAEDNDLLLTSNVDRFRVRFDTEGKRNGTPVELAAEPVAHDLGLLPRGSFYRFTLETTGGLVPARHSRRSPDPRNLGVFLDFTGEGY
ncbi:MAG TPA: hypothetical protein VHC97_09225 [Thermoanaerobaculia bacterium]|jgi:hypothetical protein|nr:hypothetical protein [Thermoanaerobaculia bacterium]